MTAPSAMTEAEIDRGLAAWLRGEGPGPDLLAVDRSRLLLRIDLHGIGPLLALADRPSGLPSDLRLALRHRLVAREMWEEQHARVLADAVRALVGAGLRPLVLKGSALAHSHFPRPAARVRGDTDLLIEEAGRPRAFAALRAAGFVQALSAGGHVVTAEALFQKPDLSGAPQDFDLHWRLNSSPVLARMFRHEDLWSRSVVADASCPGLRRPSDIDALLYAAVHRCLHVDRPTQIHLNGTPHPVVDSLCWLMDIHLLFTGLGPAARDVLVTQAVAKGVGDILGDALRDAAQRLGTDVPPGLLARLDQPGPGAVTRYLTASPARALAKDLAALDGAGARLSFLRELCLPRQDYMRACFSRGRFDWLAVLYLRRALSGLRKTLWPGRDAA